MFISILKDKSFLLLYISLPPNESPEWIRAADATSDTF